MPSPDIAFSSICPVFLIVISPIGLTARGGITLIDNTPDPFSCAIVISSPAEVFLICVTSIRPSLFIVIVLNCGSGLYWKSDRGRPLIVDKFVIPLVAPFTSKFRLSTLLIFTKALPTSSWRP